LADIFDERARIARELHDGIAQNLVAIGYALDAEIGRSDLTPAARQSLRSIREEITNVNSKVRSEIFNLRSHRDISPHEALLETLAATGIKFTLEGELPDSKSGLELYKVIQELVRNSLTHGAATNATISITPTTITCINNGNSLRGGESSGFGLQGVSERLQEIGWSVATGSTFEHIELVALK